MRWDADGTAVTRLGQLWNGVDGKPHAAAVNINEAGAIVGSEYNPANIPTALLWPAGHMVPAVLGNLGTQLDGFWLSEGFDINEAGVAVGTVNQYDSSHNLLAPALFIGTSTARPSISIR